MVAHSALFAPTRRT